MQTKGKFMKYSGSYPLAVLIMAAAAFLYSCATVQVNYDYDKDGVATANGTTDFSGSVDVLFSGATITEYDTCVDATDTIFGDLGTVCSQSRPPVLAG